MFHRGFFFKNDQDWARLGISPWQQPLAAAGFVSLKTTEIKCFEQKGAYRV